MIGTTLAIPRVVTKEGNTYTFDEIHARFAQSPAGQKLSEAVRFGSFKPETCPRERWIGILGTDVDNLDHMRLSWRLAVGFANFCNSHGNRNDLAHFSADDILELGLAACVHDWGEGMTKKGDISKLLKTQADEDEEYRILLGNVSKVAKDSGLAIEITGAVKTVLLNPDHKLAQAFNVVEKVGYFRTAVRSYEKAHEQQDRNLKFALRHLAGSVAPTWLEFLVDQAEIYPAARAFLVKRRSDIDSLLVEVSDDPTIRTQITSSGERQTYNLDDTLKTWNSFKNLA